MRIMEWNILHGGSRERFPGIIKSVKGHEPDIICFLEFRQERIIEMSLALASNGWPNVLSSQPPQNTNGILIASKKPLNIPERDYPEPNIPHRWMEVSPQGSDLRILVVHVPTATDIRAKMLFWDNILAYSKGIKEQGKRAVIIGDLNTGTDMDAEGTGFVGSDRFQSLLDLGWRDVWREYRQMSREYSWYSSKGQGHRLDHVLVSPDIGRPVWAKYSHQERLEGLSDHSPLIFDIVQKMTEEGSIKGV